MIALGIDGGLSGGLAIVAGSPGRLRLIAAIEVPCHGVDAKRRVDALAVIHFIQEHAPDVGFVERAQAFSDQGASSGFIYGRAVGALEACVAGLAIPTIIVESTAWKKYHHLSGKHADGTKLTTTQVKECSRQRAIMLFGGDQHFTRKKDHNLAEASLIGAYGVAWTARTI